MSKIQNIDGKDEVVTVDKETICWMRPKYFVGSSGSAWASEFFSIPVLNQNLFEVENTGISQYSCQFKQIRHLVLLRSRLFMDSSNDHDVLSCKKDTDSCSFSSYQMLRVEGFKKSISLATNLYDRSMELFTESEKDKLAALLQKLHSLGPILNYLHDMFIWKEGGENLLRIFRNANGTIQELEKMIDTFRLPLFKPRIFELTDAEPGVGVSNNEVCFRAAQKVRILRSSDYLIRHHLAPGDSSNEAERCQSLVGYAIVDRGSIKWEYKEIPSIQELQSMSAEEIEKEKKYRARYNVKMVCKDLAERVDGPGGTLLKGEAAPDTDEQFFNDHKYLEHFINTSKSQRESVPGNHEADDAYSIRSTWSCYWLDQFLTLALNILILSIFYISMDLSTNYFAHFSGCWASFVCSCHSILECCVTFSGVKLSIRSFVLFICWVTVIFFESHFKKGENILNL